MYSPNTFYVNRMLHEKTKNDKSFSLKQFISELHEERNIKAVILSTFKADIAYIQDVFPVYDIPVILLYDRLQNNHLIKKRKKHNPMKLCKVPSPKGSHHSKFMLVFTNDNKVYTIVSTANLVPQITIDCSWIQAFEKKTDKSPNSCNFQTKLTDYLQNVNYSAMSKSGLLVLRLFCMEIFGCDIRYEIAKYDFSTSTVDLVTSIPGNHTNAKYGHIQMKNILSNQVAPDGKLGDIIIQQTSIGANFGSIQYWNFINSLCDKSDGQDKPNDILLWAKNNKYNCNYMSADNFLDLQMDGALCKSFHIQKNSNLHTKIYLRLYKNKKRLRWIKMGSECLSIGAQGKFDGKYNLLRNWEMSILFKESAKKKLYVDDFPIPFDLDPIPYQNKDGEWNCTPYIDDISEKPLLKDKPFKFEF
jgi:hypothetical protein